MLSWTGLFKSFNDNMMTTFNILLTLFCFSLWDVDDAYCLYIFTHIYIHMHIHSCVYLQETSGSRHTPFTHRTPRASHHCSTPGFPRVTHRGPEVPQGEGNSWFERLSNLRRAMACLPLLSFREREIFALEHKAILGRESFPILEGSKWLQGKYELSPSRAMCYL